jgi:site-specific DNA-methyltransferase (adenine-specific)
VRELDQQSGVRTSGNRKSGTYGLMGYMGADDAPMPAVNGDSGGVSRFFPRFRFEAKAPTAERPRVAGESHSTVKPVALMRWLVRLVTPPNSGPVLDCFAGTGVTGQAARAEGFPAVLIDNDPAAIPWIVARLDAHPREDKPTTAQPAARQAHPDLFGGAAS